MNNALRAYIAKNFVPPQKTGAMVAFGNPPEQCRYEDAKIVLFGVPFDGTATYGGGSEYGPQVIRDASSWQIETYSCTSDYNPYDGIYDIGDFNFGKVLKGDRELIYTPHLRNKAASKKEVREAKARVDRAVNELKTLERLTKGLRKDGKVPLMLGGEHLVSLWTLMGVSGENPVLLWFDAHLDCKQEYLGVNFSHTTPMYYLTRGYMNGKDIMQVGIRQGSTDEFENAKAAGINVYKAFDNGWLFEGDRFERLKSDIAKKTEGRKVAVSFDIDAFDASLTPRTGTPSSGGMFRHHAAQLLESVSPTAKVIYLDVVEAASDGKDTREGTLATELIVDHLLAHPSLRNHSNS